MSIYITREVWELPMRPDEKLVLLAFSDYADQDGRRAYPSMNTLARRTGYSVRQVQRLTRKLEQAGYLVVEEAHPWQPRVYRVVLEPAYQETEPGTWEDNQEQTVISGGLAGLESVLEAEEPESWGGAAAGDDVSRMEGCPPSHPGVTWVSGNPPIKPITPQLYPHGVVKRVGRVTPVSPLAGKTPVYQEADQRWGAKGNRGKKQPFTEKQSRQSPFIQAIEEYQRNSGGWNDQSK